MKFPGTLTAGGVLDQLVEAKCVRLKKSKAATPLEKLVAICERLPERAHEASFAARIRRGDSTNIIAEIKHRSPSKGVIRENFDPVQIARQYSSAGAAAISVLTEEDYFGGSLDQLAAVRGSTDLPLLRKDFIFDEYQVYEAAAAGADALLLIVAILTDQLLAALLTLTKKVGLDALVEVHTSAELDRALQAGATIVGVNNRDLTTFKVDLSTSMNLASQAFGRALLVAESGIATGADVRMLKSAGFDAFLVGEHFMRSDHAGDALARLIRESQPEAATLDSGSVR
jgi:indole-3-glycerol phosphate synthase